VEWNLDDPLGDGQQKYESLCNGKDVDISYFNPPSTNKKYFNCPSPKKYLYP
jgi:hypothetical protein